MPTFTPPFIVPLTTPPDTKLRNLQAFAIIFLSIFTIIAFVFNLFIVVTIVSSYRLRNSVINYLILNLAIVNLIDVGINMVLSLMYTAIGDWKLGDFLCNFNSFMVQIVIIENFIGLALMCVDRAICLVSLERYKQRMTLIRTAVLIGSAWLLGGCFGFPILLDSVPSQPLPPRYFCSVASDISNKKYVHIGYPITIALFCIIIPAFITGCSIVVIFQARSQRVKRRASVMPGNTHFIVDNRRFQKQLALGYLTVLLVVLYAVLQGPYLVWNYTEQILNSKQRLEAGNEKFEVQEDAETAVTWIKFLYPVLFPIIIAVCSTDIWIKFQDLICCRRTNVVSTVTSNGAEQFDDPLPVEHSQENVPTLVATPGGLHLRTTEFDVFGKPANDKYIYADIRESSKGIFRGRKQSIEGTSDYDSDDGDLSDAEYLPPNDIPGASTARGTLDRSRVESRRHPENELIGGNIQKRRMEISTEAYAYRPQPLSAKDTEPRLQSISEPTDVDIVDPLFSTQGTNNSILHERRSRLNRETTDDMNGKWPAPSQNEHISDEIRELNAAKLVSAKKKAQVWDARNILDKIDSEERIDSESMTSRPSSSKSATLEHAVTTIKPVQSEVRSADEKGASKRNRNLSREKKRKTSDYEGIGSCAGTGGMPPIDASSGPQTQMVGGAPLKFNDESDTVPDVKAGFQLPKLGKPQSKQMSPMKRSPCRESDSHLPKICQTPLKFNQV